MDAASSPTATAAEFFSPETLADYLGVPVATVRKWRLCGEGPKAGKFGRHVRYRRRDVEKWIDARMSVVATQPDALGRPGVMSARRR